MEAMDSGGGRIPHPLGCDEGDGGRDCRALRSVLVRGSGDAIAKATHAYARIVPVKHRYSTPYHPKTNAVVERVNGTLGQA